MENHDKIWHKTAAAINSPSLIWLEIRNHKLVGEIVLSGRSLKFTFYRDVFLAIKESSENPLVRHDERRRVMTWHFICLFKEKRSKIIKLVIIKDAWKLKLALRMREETWKLMKCELKVFLWRLLRFGRRWNWAGETQLRHYKFSSWKLCMQGGSLK